MSLREGEPRPKPYTFIYKGILPENPYQIAQPTDPAVINLYRARIDRPNNRGPWCVMIDFPTPAKPLEPTVSCTAFFDLLGLIQEDEAIDRFKAGQSKAGDDLLLFKRSFSPQEPTICQGERRLNLKSWNYNMMGVFMEALRPVPYYDCSECNESLPEENYGKLTGHSISYIAGTASRYRNKHDIYWGFKRPEEIDGMFEPIRDKDLNH